MTVSLLTQDKGDDELARERISQAILETHDSPRSRRQRRLRRRCRRANSKTSHGTNSPSSSSSGSSPCVSPPPRPLLNSASKAISAMHGPVVPIVGCGIGGGFGGIDAANESSSSSLGFKSTSLKTDRTAPSSSTNWELSLFDDLALWDAKCRREKARKLAAKQRDAAARAAALALMQGGKKVGSSPPPLSSSVAVGGAGAPAAAVRKAAAAATVGRKAATTTAGASATFYSPDSVLLGAAAAGPWAGGSRLIQQQQQSDANSALATPRSVVVMKN